ncbi:MULTISPECIES: hypothetical protein [unclassified Streptomyces]|uniref:hypothetical protein n=1 Tax=unclassified Streptomyces TaxID=2593676 RepID=UPI0036DFE61C
MPTSADDEHDFQYPLVHNGMDYLLDAVHLLREHPDERALKYAVLHLQAAVEVLLKVPLVQEDWRLVIALPKDCEEERYRRGDFTSVSVWKAIPLLNTHLGIRLPDSAKASLDRLADHRNKLQHFGMTGSSTAIESRAAEVLDFLLDFVHEHVRPRLAAADAAHVEEQMRTARAVLSNVLELFYSRTVRLAPILDAVADRVTDCPDCGQWAMEIKGTGAVKCHFCPQDWDPEAAASAYATTLIPQGGDPFDPDFDPGGDQFEGSTTVALPCPACSKNALVCGTWVGGGYKKPEKAIDLCFNCGISEGPTPGN